MHDTTSACLCACHNGGRFATCTIPEGCADQHPHNDTTITGVSAVADPIGQRPESACVLCPPPKPGRRAWTPAHRGYKTCDDCCTDLRERLVDVGKRYQRLDATPGANLEHGSRGAPGFGSRPAASLHVVAMTDRRSLSCEVAVDDVVYVWDPLAESVLEPGQCGPPSGAYVERREVWRGADGRPHTEPSRPVRSVPKVLAGWCDMVAEVRDIRPPIDRQVPELVRWLDRHLDWVTRQDWVTDLDDDLRALVRQLKPVTGDPPATRFGACPNPVDEETQALCGASLRTPDPGSDIIICTVCGHRWMRPKWEHLGRLIQQQRMQALRAS